MSVVKLPILPSYVKAWSRLKVDTNLGEEDSGLSEPSWIFVHTPFLTDYGIYTFVLLYTLVVFTCRSDKLVVLLGRSKGSITTTYGD